MFTADFFRQNRQSLRARFPENQLLIFTANGLLQRSGSTTYPFRQDSNFWYLSGLDEPDVLLVMDGDKEYIITPDREETFEVFNGKPNVVDYGKSSGVQQTYAAQVGWTKIRAALASHKSAVTVLSPPAYIERDGIYANPARARLINKLKELRPKFELVDARAELARMRMVKQSQEIETIKQALKITTGTFQTIKSGIGSYSNENEIERDITINFLKQAAQSHAYDPIIASGNNACTLHYARNNSKLRKNQLVLIDAGAELSNYASDITRTYAITTPSQRQTELHQAVMDIRSFALGIIRPGITIKEYELAIEAYSGEVLQGLDLIKETTRENIRRYYPHATSHFIGLDTHDPADYTAPLQEGMVMTVEPGIYIAKEGLGIRQEDNILITKTGYQNLSENLEHKLG